MSIKDKINKIKMAATPIILSALIATSGCGEQSPRGQYEAGLNYPTRPTVEANVDSVQSQQEHTSFFWVRGGVLQMNGEEMTPTEAFAKFPNAVNLNNYPRVLTIQDFVSQRYPNYPNLEIDSHANMRDEMGLSDISDMGGGVPFNDFQSEANNLSRPERARQIYERGHEVFAELGINLDCNEDETQWENKYRLFNWVINNSEYDERIMGVKTTEQLNDMKLNDLFRHMVEGHSVCTGDATALSFLLNKAGIDARSATIADSNNPFEANLVHQIVLSRMGDEKFALDPTLFRTALENGTISQEGIRELFAMPKEFFMENLYPGAEVVQTFENVNLQGIKREGQQTTERTQ